MGKCYQMVTLAVAVKRLDPKAVAASLMAHPSAAVGAPHVVDALRAFADLRGTDFGTRAADGAPTPRFIAAMSVRDRLIHVVRLLLEAGASPRGMVPRDTCLAIGKSEAQGCSLPVEAAVCLIRPPELARPLVALLRSHGSALDGLCDGSCANARDSGMHCSALNCALRSTLTFHSPEFLASLSARGLDESILFDRDVVICLLQSGAASVHVTGPLGRMTAAQAAFSFAAFIGRESFVNALLGAGVSPDFPALSPSLPPFPPSNSHILRVVVEAATNEELGVDCASEPYLEEMTREALLRMRVQRNSRLAGGVTDGPAARILRAMIAVGCPVGLASRVVSSVTGSHSSILTFPARAGAVDVVKCLLAAGARPDALADEADPFPSRAPSGVETALDIAASSGRVDLVRALLDAGADPGRSPRPLAAAAMDGFTDVLQVLLAAPRGCVPLEAACVQPLGFAGMTPLMVAALYQQAGAVATLIAAGAKAAPHAALAAVAAALGVDPDDPRAAKTPMGAAIRGGASPDVIEELVRGGAERPVLAAGTRSGGGSPGVVFYGSTGACVPQADSAGLLLRLKCDVCATQAEPGPRGRTLLLCSRCKLRRYCSAACQRVAWKGGHAQECKALRGAASAASAEG